MSEFLYRIDFAVIDFFNETVAHPVLDAIFGAITFLGDAGWFWIALTALLLLFKKTRLYGLAMAISLILSTLMTNVILKPLVNRPRPYELNPDILLRTDPPHDASFPSGHTSASFAAALALFGQNKKLGTPALVLATLIGISRLYFYLHFLTDVLGGSLVGFLASVASFYLTPLALKGIETIKQKYKKNGGKA